MPGCSETWCFFKFANIFYAQRIKIYTVKFRERGMVIKLIKIGVRALKKLTKIGAIKVTQNRGRSITIE